MFGYRVVAAGLGWGARMGRWFWSLFALYLCNHLCLDISLARLGFCIV